MIVRGVVIEADVAPMHDRRERRRALKWARGLFRADLARLPRAESLRQPKAAEQWSRTWAGSLRGNRARCRSAPERCEHAVS